MRSFSHFSPLKSFLPNLLRPPHFHHHQLMASRAARFGALVDKMQQLVQSDPLSGWEKCWEIGLTTWDLREPTPIVEHLVRNDLLPKGRALVPGCGSGYDVVTLASPDRYVIGLDLSKSAVKRAGELAATSSNGTCFSFVQADFFTWNPTELFDLIFDYTLMIMTVDRLTKYQLLIMKRFCTRWVSKQYLSLRMSLLYPVVREGRSLEGGKG
ncbi:putative thiol methyltransferase 2 isoform X5 [Silene latifolia]|uniref:putative thiol methyltransferase 2 isoform X5 n=1 Tax=Silene latifolia TaxID=37657 RepID=UPI003D77B52D